MHNLKKPSWYTSIHSLTDGKLCSYKANFGCEKYLSIVQNFNLRRSLTRLRLSAHQLAIEKGRYMGIPRHNRVCPRCSSGEIEDEMHFLFNCNSLKNERHKLISIIDNNCINFTKLDIKSKLIWLMSNENTDILYELCSFINMYEKQ